MNTPHPELHALAELADGPDASVSDELLAHVTGCAQCSADVESLRGVRETLRSLPPIEMPDDVAARLELALRSAMRETSAEDAVSPAPPATSAPTVLPLRTGRAGDTDSVRHRLPHFSAAAAVTVLVIVALGAGIAVMATQGSHSRSSNATSSAGMSVASTVVTASHTDYSQASIRDQVAALILARVPDGATRYKGLDALVETAGSNLPAASSAAAAAPSVPAAAPFAGDLSAAGGTSTSSANGAVHAAEAPTAPSGPLASSTALQACVVALLGQPATPVLVDYAIYEGKPATIMVLPDPTNPSVLDLYVEADTANCARDGDVTYFASLPIAS